MNNKHIFLLIGQKGSGKSFIGTLMAQSFGIRFIRVEDFARKIKKDRAADDEAYVKEVFGEIEKGIRQGLIQSDKVAFESTGLTPYFDRMLQRLRRDFPVTTISVHAGSVTCLKRVKSRDRQIHINISDDQVLMINEKVRERNLKTDFSIHNENKSEKELIDKLGQIIYQAFKGQKPPRF